MNFIVISWLLIGFSTVISLGLPENEADYAAWESRSLAAISSYSRLPPEQAIPKLGNLIARLAEDRTPNSEKGYKPVLNAARATLLAIPGHADVYGKAIKELQFKLESAPKDERWNYANDYSRLQWNSFRTLGQLPSSETVRVLGGFLYDESGGLNLKGGDTIPTEGEIMSQQKKNCDGAASALFTLIDSPPMKDVGWLKPEAVEMWRVWYEQVKSGTRTFRFKGNPVEFDLNGAAPPDKLQRIARDQKRDAERLAGRRKSSAESGPGAGMERLGRPSWIAGVGAALLLLAAAAWYRRQRG